MDGRECKRCLLYEMADKAAYEGVKNYIDSMRDDEKVSQEIYKQRLDVCRGCDFLLSGMCRKCGCYVEIRAIGKGTSCPGKKW